jgi:hypothetical protein
LEKVLTAVTPKETADFKNRFSHSKQNSKATENRSLCADNVAKLTGRIKNQMVLKLGPMRL